MLGCLFCSRRGTTCDERLACGECPASWEARGPPTREPGSSHTSQPQVLQWRLPKLKVARCSPGFIHKHTAAPSTQHPPSASSCSSSAAASSAGAGASPAAASTACTAAAASPAASAAVSSVPGSAAAAGSGSGASSPSAISTLRTAAAATAAANASVDCPLPAAPPLPPRPFLPLPPSVLPDAEAALAGAAAAALPALTCCSHSGTAPAAAVRQGLHGAVSSHASSSSSRQARAKWPSH